MKLVDVPCNLCGSVSRDVIARGPDFEYRTSDLEFSVVRCRKCNFVYLSPRPDVSELDRIYPPHYIPYRFDNYLSPLVRWLRMRVQMGKVRALARFAPENAAILDVGCGGGFFLQCLREHGSPGWRLTGSDFSGSAMDRVRRMNFEAIPGDFSTQSIPNESYDVVVLNQVIEHMADPSAIVTKAYRVLRPGGVIFVETPSLEGWDAQLFRKRCWGGYHFPRHWSFFTQESLGRLLATNGFVVVETTWLLSPNFWAQSVHHWLTDRGVNERAAMFFDCKNPLALAVFSLVDLAQKAFAHTSNLRMAGRKCQGTRLVTKLADTSSYDHGICG